MSAPEWIGFVAAAATGAVVRYLVHSWLQEHPEGVMPWGTFTVNATGSFVFGLLTGLVLYHGFPTSARVILGTGFCGAYTTFSAFTFETVRLLEEGAIGEAFRNVLGTFVVCLGAAIAGFALGAL